MGIPEADCIVSYKPSSIENCAPQLIEDICSRVVIKPAVLQEYAQQPHIWLNANDKLPTDGSAFLPIAQARVEHYDNVTRKERLSSIGVEVKWSSCPDRAGVLFEFKADIFSIKGASGENLNHGSGLALIDEKGTEIKTAPIIGGSCTLQAEDIRFYGEYSLRYKTKLDQEEPKSESTLETINNKTNGSRFGNFIDTVKRKGKKIKDSIADITIK